MSLAQVWDAVLSVRDAEPKILNSPFSILNCAYGAKFSIDLSA